MSGLPEPRQLPEPRLLDPMVVPPPPVPQVIVVAPPQYGFVPLRTSNGLHLTLTLLTCGAWAPVWIICLLINNGKRDKRAL
jgi:hypothetical protein